MYKKSKMRLIKQKNLSAWLNPENVFLKKEIINELKLHDIYGHKKRS